MASPEPTAIGRYMVVSRLGQGGMGSLYLAKDPKIGRLVAIKLVRQEFDSPEARQRFAREAQSAGTLRHPNIVTIFDVDEHEGLPFIAMEYIDGETLAEIVKRKALLPIARRIQWVEDLCSGLAYAHRQGVVHRDIKPANLMVDTEGSLKILDFGLARRDASKFTQSHVIIGSPNYMSPEQIRGDNIDTRSDIFAVGALFYELLTYKEAFPGAVHQSMHKILHEEPEPLEQFLPDCDPSLSEIVGLAIMKNRDDRYADLSVMKNDLAEVRARIEAPAEDKDTTPMPRDPRFSQPASRAGSHGSKRYDVDRMSLQRRRVEQITALLDEARWMLENGALEKARAKCEEALMFDPDHPVGRELIADIAIEGDRRQVAAWINDARAELQKGQLDGAEPLVAQARELAPESVDVRQLQETIDTTRRTRQMQEIMRRARTRFSEGSFEAAIRAAGEVLALDPENAQAKELQERARESIEQEAARAARDAAARSARTVQDPPRSPSRSGRSIEIADSAARSESAHSVQAASPRSLSRSGQRPAAVSETAHALRGAQEEAPDLPLWQNLQVIAATFGVVLVTVAVGYFAYSSSTPPPSPTGDPASAPRQGPSPTPDPAGSASAGQGPGALVPGNTTVAAQPVAVPPAPPPVVAPAALTEKRALTQDDKDILAAFAFLNGGDIPRAQTLAVGVLRRNPNHPHLLALTTAIEARVVSEKERADAEARRK